MNGANAMPIEYDLVVIGATELGCRMARRAAELGARVALVAQSVTPESEVRYRTVVRSSLPPLESMADTLAWLDFQVQDALTELSAESLQLAGVDYITHTGAFVQKPIQGFQVDHRLLRSSHYVSALSGDRTVPLGLSNTHWITPETLVKNGLALKAKQVAIVGEMPVGIELALALRSQGIQVLLVIPTSQVLPMLDRALGDRIQLELEAKGVELLVGKSCEDQTVRDRIAACDQVVLATQLAKRLPERLGLRSLNGVAAKQNRLRLITQVDGLTENVSAIALAEVRRLLKPWEKMGRNVRSGSLVGLDAGWVAPPKSPLIRGTLSWSGMSLGSGRLWYRLEIGKRGEILGCCFVGDRAIEWTGIFTVAIGAGMRLPDLLQLSLPEGLQTALAAQWLAEWERQARSPLFHEFFLDWLGFVRRRSK